MNKNRTSAEGLTKQFFKNSPQSQLNGAVVVNKSFMAPAHVNILNKCFFSYFEKLQSFQKEPLFFISISFFLSGLNSYHVVLLHLIKILSMSNFIFFFKFPASFYVFISVMCLISPKGSTT